MPKKKKKTIHKGLWELKGEVKSEQGSQAKQHGRGGPWGDP